MRTAIKIGHRPRWIWVRMTRRRRKVLVLSKMLDVNSGYGNVNRLPIYASKSKKKISHLFYNCKRHEYAVLVHLPGKSSRQTRATIAIHQHRRRLEAMMMNGQMNGWPTSRFGSDSPPMVHSSIHRIARITNQMNVDAVQSDNDVESSLNTENHANNTKPVPTTSSAHEWKSQIEWIDSIFTPLYSFIKSFWIPPVF